MENKEEFKNLEVGIEGIFSKALTNHIKEPEIDECIICLEGFNEHLTQPQIGELVN